MRKAVFLVISAPKRLNHFMHCCDVFELGKVLGDAETFELTYTPDTVLTIERAAEAIEHTRNALESADRIVSFVHLQYVQRDNILELNHNLVPPYVNPEVRIISTGDKWYMLDDFLRHLGLTVETNEHRFITNVT